MIKRYFSILLVALVAALSLAGCSNKQPSQKVSDEISHQVETNQIKEETEEEVEEEVKNEIPVETNEKNNDSTVSLEEFINNPSFIMNGETISLPCQYEDLEKLGFYWDVEHDSYKKLSGTKVEAGAKTKEVLYLLNDSYDDNVKYIIHTRNFTEEVIDFEDTSVYRITINAEDGSSDITKLRPDVTLACGVTWCMTADEVKGILGEPDDVHSGEAYDKYTYCFDKLDVIVQIGKDSGVNSISLQVY